MPIASQAKPWSERKLRPLSEKPWVFESVDGKAFLKDSSFSPDHAAQLSFNPKDYSRGEKAAREHALLAAKFHALLARKGYFHPKTLFGVYADKVKRGKVFRVFAVMPRLGKVDAHKQTRPAVRRLVRFLHEHGVLTPIYDLRRVSPIEGFASNFGVAENGRVYATDLGLWSTRRIPTAWKLKQILKKEKY